MGPTIRPFGYRRDPWWDATGRTSRRRRRRRLVAWSAVLVLGATLGLVAGEARAAGSAGGAPSAAVTHSAVTQSAAGAP